MDKQPCARGTGPGCPVLTDILTSAGEAENENRRAKGRLSLRTKMAPSGSSGLVGREECKML